MDGWYAVVPALHFVSLSVSLSLSVCLSRARMFSERPSLSLISPYSLGAESRKKSYAKHFGYKLATGLHLKKIEF